MNSNNTIHFKNANFRNVKNAEIKIPLYAITCITGVSGSGKSTLAEIIVEGVKSNTPKLCKTVKNAELIKSVYFVNQSPIGKNSRSMVATYLDIYDEIRNFFANTESAENAGIPASYFSVNLQGGDVKLVKGQERTKLNLLIYQKHILLVMYVMENVFLRMF